MYLFENFQKYLFLVLLPSGNSSLNIIQVYLDCDSVRTTRAPRRWMRVRCVRRVKLRRECVAQWHHQSGRLGSMWSSPTTSLSEVQDRLCEAGAATSQMAGMAEHEVLVNSPKCLTLLASCSRREPDSQPVDRPHYQLSARFTLLPGARDPLDDTKTSLLRAVSNLLRDEVRPDQPDPPHATREQTGTHFPRHRSPHSVTQTREFGLDLRLFLTQPHDTSFT